MRQSRVNLTLFPDTPANLFLDGDRRRGAGLDGEAYRLSFGPEGAGPSRKESLHYARLVRSAK